MKKFIAYSIIFSLIASNTVFAAKELINSNDSNQLVRFKPIVNGYYANDDWYIDSSTGTLHGPNEQTNLNKSRTFNDLTTKALDHSPEALAALFQHANVYLRGDQLELFLPLKGGGNGPSRPSNNYGGGGSRFIVEVRPRPRHIRTVRPDEVGIGTGRPSTLPPKNPRISGPRNSGPTQRAPIKSRGPVNNGPSEQEQAQAKKAQAQKEKQLLQKQYGNTIANDYEKAQHVQHLINTASWDAVYQYADSNGISRDKVAFISQNRTGLNFDKYIRGTNTFHGEYEKADHVSKLINTSTWKAVYDYADSNGISRENVAYINQNRALLNFENYMRSTNPTYAMYDQAKHIQHLINTDTWKNVWSFAESKGISKAQVMQGLNGRRTEDLSFTLKATNIRGAVAYTNPLLNNGLVYPVKQTTQPNPEQLLPSGYQRKEQDELLGITIARATGQCAVDIFNEIGIPKAHAHPLAQAAGTMARPALAGCKELATVAGVAVSHLIKANQWDDLVQRTAQKFGCNLPTASQYAKAVKTCMENLVTVIDLTLVRPVTTPLPQFDQNKLKILETWDIEDGVKILTTPAELEKATNIEMGVYDGQKITILNQDYIAAPKQLTAFPDATKAREKTYIKGAGKRKRWKDKDHIYEWDSRHGKVEKYTSQGTHLGEFDPETGEQTKPADPSRRVEK